jgi:hypothetical protein
MEYYRKYGNPHLKDILEKLQNSKSTDEQAQEKLREVEKEIEGKNNNSISEGRNETEDVVNHDSNNDLPEPEMSIVEEIQGGTDDSRGCDEDAKAVEETVEHDGISEEYAEFEEIKDDTEQPS